jgi:hypothetical protein
MLTLLPLPQFIVSCGIVEIRLWGPYLGICIYKKIGGCGVLQVDIRFS